MSEAIKTAPKDRLQQLFAGKAWPAAPIPDQPHFSQQELEQKAAQDEKPWNIPAVVQYPRKVKPEQRPVKNGDPLTSSDDEDDYISAFKKKPAMKPENDQPGRGGPRPGEKARDAKSVAANHQSSLTNLSHDKLDESTSRRFCQFALVAMFPYKYMNDAHDRVSRHFFASNKFYDRAWNLYYLHPPFTLSARVLVLVPFEQVQELVDEIARTFDIVATVPGFPFTLSFYDDGTPQPQFLGISKSRSQAGDLQTAIPPAPYDHGICPTDATSQTQERFKIFKRTCEQALTASKKKVAGAKRKVEEDRLLTVRDWYLQLRRAQKYLGLRPKSGEVQHPDPDWTWDEQQEFRKRQLKDAKVVLDPLNLNSPVPHPFEKEPIFISIDIESYERDHSLITEIGVSTLDTLDVVDLPPGLGGKNWMDHIRSRHFRINERQHFVNRDFCVGDPDAFLFGQSEFVFLKDAAEKVDDCFVWPFSVQYKHAQLSDPWDAKPSEPGLLTTTAQGPNHHGGIVRIAPTDKKGYGAARAEIAKVLDGIGTVSAAKPDVKLAEAKSSVAAELQRGPRDRNIILVGHDLRGDLEYLRALGSKIFAPSRGTYPIAAMEILGSGGGASSTLTAIVEGLDTAPLYRVLKQETQNRSLGSIAHDLGRPAYFMHNGGNDARYTLEVAMAMLIQARLEQDKSHMDEDRTVKAGQSLTNPETAGRGEQSSSRQMGHQAGLATGRPRKEDLDDFEAAVLASSGSEAFPPRTKDDAIAALAEALKLEPDCE